MIIAENVKHLRKEVLKLSRADFGKRLGVSSDVINNIELGRLARPEQKEPLLRLMCSTFNVNYEWLTAGEGEMLVETKESFIKRLTEEYNAGQVVTKILEAYLNLDDDQRVAIDEWFGDIAEALTLSAPVNVISLLDKRTALNKQKAAASTPANTEIADEIAAPQTSDAEIEAEAAAYAEKVKAEFIREKRQERYLSSLRESDTRHGQKPGAV